ncbi:Uma2 family endonuclease [Lewinella sp. LCG006]|uniref:Uma2 family endonuclease n=1 Tax=Lewinella sp. LCG006 TaxID=3231911 RepID=UPI00346029C7
MSTTGNINISKRYTYAEYLQWSLEESVELIRGQLFKKAPAPNLRHQEVSGNLHYLIKKFLWKESCKVFHAPFDVRLPLLVDQQKDEDITTVVQPDICVVCDPDKLDARGCVGAPDWIIEILSPATSSKDLREKYQIYEQVGVKEYWVIHPHEETLQIFRLNEEGIYEGRALPYVREDIVQVTSLPGLEIKLDDVFSD